MGATTRLTVDEYLALPEDQLARTELIDGEIIEMSGARLRHERVKGEILTALSEWRLDHRLEFEVLAETQFQLDSGDALRPDISVCESVMLNDLDPEQVALGAPQVAVEVVSSDEAAQLERKIRLYLAHRCSEVWVVYPNDLAVYVHQADHVKRLAAGDTLTSEALPGFSVPVARLVGQPSGCGGL